MQYKTIFNAVILLLTMTLMGCQSGRELPPPKRVTTVVITPVPAAKESVIAPAGYSKCFIVKDSLYQQMWIPAHSVCQYEDVHGHVVSIWVSGYWACARYNKNTGVQCHAWVWKPAHLVQYGVLPSSRVYYY